MGIYVTQLYLTDLIPESLFIEVYLIIFLSSMFSAHLLIWYKLNILVGFQSKNKKDEWVYHLNKVKHFICTHFKLLSLSLSLCVCVYVSRPPADPAENSPADKKSKKATPTSESEFPKYAAASFLLSQ